MAQVATRDGHQFALASSPQPVLELLYRVEMLAEAVPPLHYQLYADGRLVADVPFTWKNAGHYELQLNRAQVDQLVSSLIDAGVLDTTSSQIEAEVAAIERQRVAAQLRHRQNETRQSELGQTTPADVFAVSDDETLEIRLRLDRFRASGSGVSLVDFEHHLAIDNLHVNARTYSELPTLGGLSDAVGQIEALADTSVMNRSEPAP
jgi:hypothetical protein